MRSPEFERDIVGNEFAFSGKFQEGSPNVGVKIEITKDVATGEVAKSGNATDHPSLSSFTGAGRSKN
jgi:hypothetical protein